MDRSVRPPRVAETHTASLFFTGDRVYKIKKPVRYGFIDLSTRAAREHACRREVELNRRLAPDVYLGVAAILGPDGETCEHAVVMRRLPEERRLSRLLRSPEAAGRVREIARTVAAFHARAGSGRDVSAIASRDAIRTAWRDNLDEIERFADGYLDGPMLARVRELAMRFLAGREPLFAQRIAAGKIVDGHGDLLADDIFCLDDGPRILDCLEFSDALRYGDVVADVAFLAMDLEHRGRPDLAAQLFTWYREYSGDNPPASLIHFSIAHRALIRAKVACLRAEQTGGGGAPSAARLLGLALGHLERAQVRLVLVGGLPGTGKTMTSHGIADARGFAHLHSDETRKELAGLSYGSVVSTPFGHGLYSPEMSERTYREMLRRAAALLRRGTSVVLDATWTDAALRDRAAATAAEVSANLFELRCAAPSSIAKIRILGRTPGSEASDATPQVAAVMAARADPWPAAVRLDTTVSGDEVLGRALGTLDRREPDEPWLELLVAPAPITKIRSSEGTTVPSDGPVRVAALP